MTVFLTGDNFGRRITAKEANRILRAGQEQEAGLANVSVRDVQRVWENGHILVRNDSGQSVPAFSVLGYAGSPQYIDPNRANVGQQLVVFIGQRYHAYKHFFRHCVLQTSALMGEVVPAAISGVTFARIKDNEGGSATYRTGEKLLVQHIATQDGGDNAAIGSYFYRYRHLDSQTEFGQAQVIKFPAKPGDDSFNAIRSRGLVLLRQFTPIWRGTMSTIESGTRNYTGKITAFEGITETIVIRDPFQVVPNAITSGEITSAVVGLQLGQNEDAVSDPATLPNIRAAIVTIDNYTATRFVVSEPP
jgi:hypothetical protein